MPTLTIPESTYAKLAQSAASRQVSVEMLVLPMLEMFANAWFPRVKLTTAERLSLFDEHTREMNEPVRRDPADFPVNIDRDFSYPTDEEHLRDVQWFEEDARKKMTNLQNPHL